MYWNLVVTQRRRKQMTHFKAYPFYIGFNARLFANSWRPIREELVFARASRFSALQIRKDDSSIDEHYLGDSFLDVSRLMRKNRLITAVELVMHVDEKGQTPGGGMPVELFEANLPAIQALNSTFVHWHLIPKAGCSRPAAAALESSLIAQFATGVSTAQQYGIQLGFKQNQPDHFLFSTPQSCQAILDRVPHLMFVWDLNHTHPDHLPGFLSLAQRMSMVHISDTPLPDAAPHSPLADADTDDFETCLRQLLNTGFTGPAILKMDELGRDSDEALQNLHKRFKKVVECCLNPNPPA
jgi:L-ribulose-5-phosphate 3-epimerase